MLGPKKGPPILGPLCCHSLYFWTHRQGGLSILKVLSKRVNSLQAHRFASLRCPRARGEDEYMCTGSPLLRLDTRKHTHTHQHVRVRVHVLTTTSYETPITKSLPPPPLWSLVLQYTSLSIRICRKSRPLPVICLPGC